MLLPYLFKVLGFQTMEEDHGEVPVYDTTRLVGAQELACSWGLCDPLTTRSREMEVVVNTLAKFVNRGGEQICVATMSIPFESCVCLLG